MEIDRNTLINILKQYTKVSSAAYGSFTEDNIAYLKYNIHHLEKGCDYSINPDFADSIILIHIHTSTVAIVKEDFNNIKIKIIREDKLKRILK